VRIRGALLPLAAVLCASCGGAALDGPTGAPPPIRLTTEGTRQELAGHFSLLRDPQRRLDVEQALSPERASLWHLCRAAQANFGYTPDTYWVHVVLENASRLPAVRVLELPKTLDAIDLFTDDGRGGLAHERTGRKVPFSKRRMKTSELAFRLTLAPNETRHVWLRITSEASLFIYPVLWAEDAFAAQLAQRDLKSAAYFGALAAMALFKFFIWISVRDRAYLYYALFQATVLVALAALEHNTFRLLWPESPEWASRSSAFFLAPVLFAGAGFARSFVGLEFLSRAAQRATRATMGLAVGLGVVSLLSDHPLVQRSASLSVVTTCAVLLAAGLDGTFRGSPNGRIFVFAWLILLASGILAACTSLGLFEWQPMLLEVPRVGSSMEAVLLSFGLARRIKIANRERERTQRHLIEIERAQSQLLERRVAERTLELEQALGQLEAVQERMIKQARLAALGHLTAGVAHEIGNPLNFVLGGAKELAQRLNLVEAALRDVDSRASSVVAEPLSQARRATALVENGSERIHRIIETLRGHTRSRKGSKEPVDVIAVVEATLGLIHPLTDKQKIEVVRELPRKSVVMSWSGELDQVFLNLLLNSCQAMPEGGRLTVRVSSTPEGPLEIVVSDTGAGIPREHRDSIFDPFFTTRPSDGVGLGLSLSLRIVEEHGGDLTLLESRQGATFLISLPASGDAAPVAVTR